MRRVEQVAFIFGNYEPLVAAAMQRHVRPGMVVYDIRANVGYFSMMFALWVGSEGKVVSFEPDPKNLAVLRHNIASNDFSNTAALGSAITDANGEVQFATFDYSLVGHIARAKTPKDATVVRVPAVTLDDFVYEQKNAAPQFLKVDVEGAEEQVLQGASRVLSEARPDIIIELRHSAAAAIEALARKYRYRLEPVSGGAARLQRCNYDEYLMLPIEA